MYSECRANTKEHQVELQNKAINIFYLILIILKHGQILEVLVKCVCACLCVNIQRQNVEIMCMYIHTYTIPNTYKYVHINIHTYIHICIKYLLPLNYTSIQHILC